MCLRSSGTCSTSLNYRPRRPLELKNNFPAIKVIVMRASCTSIVSLIIRVKRSITVTTDTPWLKQQSHSRRRGASQNSARTWSTTYAHTRPTCWNPNSSTMESDLLQDDHSVTCCSTHQQYNCATLSHCALVLTPKKKIQHVFKKCDLNLIF
jgi:hypothetical protein